MSWKFNITSAERIGMTVCLILLTLIIGISVIYDVHKRSGQRKVNEALRVEYVEFLKNDSIKKAQKKALKESRKKQNKSKKKKAGKKKPVKQQEPERDFLDDIVD